MIFVNLTENLFIDNLTKNQLDKKISELYWKINSFLNVDKKDVYFVLDELKEKNITGTLSSFNIIHSHNFQYFISLFIKWEQKDLIILTYDNKDLFFINYWKVYLIEKDGFTILDEDYCLNKFEIKPNFILDYLFLKMNSPFSLWDKKIIDLLESINWLENIEIDKIAGRRTRALLKINKKRIDFYIIVKKQILRNINYKNQ